MTTDAREKTLVVIQLTGGNDFMNTLVPYTNEHYYDARKKIVIGQNDVLPINKTLGINNNAAPLKRLFDEGKVAIVQGIGYPNSNRSHFRGMDIWHTCEPDRVGSEGWLGLAIKDLDPKSENVENHSKKKSRCIFFVRGVFEQTTALNDWTQSKKIPILSGRF